MSRPCRRLARKPAIAIREERSGWPSFLDRECDGRFVEASTMPSADARAPAEARRERRPSSFLAVVEQFSTDLRAAPRPTRTICGIVRVLDRAGDNS